MILVYTLYMHDAKKFIWFVQTAHLFSWILEWQLHSCEYYLSIKLAWQKSLSIIFISLLTINRMLNLDKIWCLHVQTRLRYCRGLGHMPSYAGDEPCTVVCTGHGTARAPHLRVMQSILKHTQSMLCITRFLGLQPGDIYIQYISAELRRGDSLIGSMNQLIDQLLSKCTVIHAIVTL